MPTDDHRTLRFVELLDELAADDAHGSRRAAQLHLGVAPSYLSQLKTRTGALVGTKVMGRVEEILRMHAAYWSAPLGTSYLEFVRGAYVETGDDWVDTDAWTEIEADGLVDEYRAAGVREPRIEAIRRTPLLPGEATANEYLEQLDVAKRSGLARKRAARRASDEKK